MKKLISFSVFLTLVLVVVLVKTSRAQTTAINARVELTTSASVWENGYWKWNPLWKRNVWVKRHPMSRPFVRRSKRTLIIS